MFAKWKLSIILAAIILAGALIYSAYAINSHANKSLKKNYGIANATINIHSNGISDKAIDIDSVVPSEDKLIKNLTKHGYTIIQHDTIDNINISVNRIYAKKGNSFIDICYGLSDTDAKAVFQYYENTYNTYYLMAQNKSYVYCISDKKTFKDAGFSSLTNVGIQYIRE